MAAKKTQKRSKTLATKSEPDILGGLQAFATALENHDGSIRQLAEVVVNLHRNVRSLRDLLEPLAEASSDERVVRALGRLRRVRLEQ
jgi:hypothetical protein